MSSDKDEPYLSESGSSSSDNNDDSDYEDTSIGSKRTRRNSSRGMNSKKSRAEVEEPPIPIEEMSNASFDKLIGENTEVESIVSAWIQLYRENQSQALVEIVNFLLKCCGCNKPVNDFDVQDSETASTTLSQIQVSVEKQISGDYPLVSKSLKYKAFKSRLVALVKEFINQLYRQQYLFLSNNKNLFLEITSWLVAMSSSTLRPIRHTATFFCMNITSRLCDLCGRMLKEKNTLSKQLATEENRSRINFDRIDSIRDSIDELSLHETTIHEYLNDYFDSVFVHRYRDVEPRIRCESLHELGYWITTLPSVFLGGAYLRYLGWMLSDANASIRLTAIRALTKVYSDESFLSALRHFSMRFKERIVDICCYDVDLNVRISAIRLCNSIRACGFFEEEDIDKILDLLFDFNVKVQKEIASFLVSYVDELFAEKLELWGGRTAISLELQKNLNTTFSITWLKYSILTKLLSKIVNSVTQKSQEISALLPYKMEGCDKETPLELAIAPMLKIDHDYASWTLLMDYLLYDEDYSSQTGILHEIFEECNLTEELIVTVLQILFASLKAAFDPAFYSLSRKGQQPKEKEIASANEHVDTEQLSYECLPLIIGLLEKFSSLSQCLQFSLRLLLNLQPQVLSTSQMRPVLEDLLKVLQKIFSQTNDYEVIHSCAYVFVRLQGVSLIENSLSISIYELGEKLLIEFNAFFSNHDLTTVYEDTTYRTAESLLKKLESITSLKNMIRDERLKVTLNILKDLITLPENKTFCNPNVCLLHILQNLIFWCVNDISESEDDTSNRSILTEAWQLLTDVSLSLIQQEESGVLQLQASQTYLETALIYDNMSGVANDEAVLPKFNLPEEIEDAILCLLDNWFYTFSRSFGTPAVKIISGRHSRRRIITLKSTLAKSLIEQICCDLLGKVLMLGNYHSSIYAKLETLHKMKGYFGPKIGAIFNEMVPSTTSE
ncbi:mitotic cohesin complex [Schizosaccharomyces japonicus yFS275]|uniref:Mitotic cohesin complex n=1 Tax=Schizosaccharomyces japonicus (strain yFS275 / FY16936) TaxID=402676 RepID=B6K465_SCHJY|nr:mitotic cohesin complex [Schizosaccharomyces japonicus yFS275]EEB08272.1 mitotic cohesin complex [Schizosaccharomyces japonicus yFS275]